MRNRPLCRCNTQNIRRSLRSHSQDRTATQILDCEIPQHFTNTGTCTNQLGYVAPQSHRSPCDLGMCNVVAGTQVGRRGAGRDMPHHVLNA